MECRDVDKLMDDFLDRELDEAAAGEIRGHLGGCPVCHRQWGSLIVLLSDPEPVEVPAGLRDRIVDAWEHRQEQPVAAGGRGWRRGLRHLRHIGAIAACMLFFITGWVLSGRWGGTPPGSISVPDQPATVTVVVSPWILSSMARAAAMPAPVSPVVMLASGAVPELMIPEPRMDESIDRLFPRPASPASQPVGPQAPRLELLPILPSFGA